MNMFPNIIGGGGKKKKFSACVDLPKGTCRFPCRRVKTKRKNGKGKGNCRTIYSRKKMYYTKNENGKYVVVNRLLNKKRTKHGKKSYARTMKMKNQPSKIELQPYITPEPEEKVVPVAPVEEETVEEKEVPVVEETIPVVAEEQVEKVPVDPVAEEEEEEESVVKVPEEVEEEEVEEEEVPEESVVKEEVVEDPVLKEAENSQGVLSGITDGVNSAVKNSEEFLRNVISSTDKKPSSSTEQSSSSDQQIEPKTGGKYSRRKKTSGKHRKSTGKKHKKNIKK
jgi:hypothetical protein